MADLLRIKNNVAKMASMNAPESDIDGYITSEGVTIEDIKNFNPSEKSALPFPARFYSPQLQVAQPAIQAGFQGLPESLKAVIQSSMEALPLTGQALGDIAVRKTLAPTPIPPKLKRFIYALGGVSGAMAGERGKQIGEEILGKEITPEARGKELTNVAKNAALAEALGWGVEKAVTPIWRVTGGKLPFIKKLRGAFVESKAKAGKEFAEGLNLLEKQNPNAVIDISDDIVNLRNSIKGTVENPVGNPAIITQIRAGQKKVGSNLLEALIDDPMKAQNLTLTEARQIRQIIQKSPEITRNLAQGKVAKWEPSHLDLMDFADNIKAKIAQIFPDIKGVNLKYADTVNKYNQIKNYFRTGKLTGAIETAGKGLREPEIWNEYVKPLLKDNPQILRELSSYFRTQGIGKAISRIGMGAGIGSLIYGATRKR